MKLPESLFARILLAYLPFMAYPFDFLRTTVAALWVVSFFWGTVFFFWFTRRFFPERFLKTAFFLWIIVWAQAAWFLTKLQPFWVLSVFLLMPVSFLEPGNRASRIKVFSRVISRYFWERFLTGAGFLGLVLILVITRDFMGHRLQIEIFQQPAGTFLVLAAIAAVWKCQPFER